MENKLPCYLIQDILTGYDDEKISSESKQDIEDHLQNCPQCAAFLQQMKAAQKNSNSHEETDRYIKIGKKIRKRKTITVISVTILFVLMLAFLYTTFSPVLVSGNSMSPTILNGQKLFLNKLAYSWSSPKRLDIVAYQSGNSLKIGRVMAYSNESVKIKKGTIYINHKALTFSHLPKNFSQNEFTVKKGTYFIMQDNANHSVSTLQFIPKSHIIGKFHVKGR